MKKNIIKFYFFKLVIEIFESIEKVITKYTSRISSNDKMIRNNHHYYYNHHNHTHIGIRKYYRLHHIHNLYNLIF